MVASMPAADIAMPDLKVASDAQRLNPELKNMSEMQADHLYSIGAMARDFNISLRTLRFYEDRGLLHPVRRGSTRSYTPADRRHLEMILRGKQLGFTLTEIFDLIHSRKDVVKPADLESALQPDQIIAQIHHLERQREEIDVAINALRTVHQRAADRWSPARQQASEAV